MSTADFLKSPSDHFPPGSAQSSAATAFLSPAKGLEVTETSRSVRVETEKPHLVSLGGGRLSTAVTIHPLPEGRTYIGRGDGSHKPDILVDGTGVEPRHCYIENVRNVVTIHPVAPMAVDGMRIVEPTRLSQGSMVCLGLSTFFRFNHPQEAKRMKQTMPAVSIPMASASFHPVLEDPLLPDHSVHGTLDIPRSLQSLESSDFVEKVSKFEYLAHSRPATVTSQDTPKWLVREGIRIPSTPPPARVSGRLYGDQDETSRTLNNDGFSQFGSKSLPMRNNSVTLPSRTKPPFSFAPPASPGLKRVQDTPIRASPIMFWSGKCTPTLSHLGEGFCGHEEHLRACEDELKKQHEKAVQERLKEEEQVRQEQHRLEEILNMCAEYEHQEKMKLERKHQRAPSSFSQSPNHSVPVSTPNISNSPNHKPNNTSLHSSSPTGYNNSVPHHHHHLAHHQNRIKTNGSLPRDRSQALQQSTLPNDCPGSASPLSLHKTVNSASSEDELNEILGDNSQSQSSNATDHFEPHISTSPHLGTGSLKYPHSPRTSHRVTNQVQAEIEVHEDRYPGPELRRKAVSRTAYGPNSPNFPPKKDAEKFYTRETYQEINEDLRRLCKLKVDYVRQISALKKAFANFEAQENEILRELEMEHALISGELKDEERILIVQQKRLDDFHTKENQMLEEAEKAKSDEQEQLESAKQQLREREERVSSLKKKIEELTSRDSGGSEEERHEVEESFKRELELMEAERKAFEDLEFQQLESQSHREDEKEALTISISQQTKVLQEREERRVELEVQQKDLQQQIIAERDMFHSKMRKVTESMSEFQVKLESLDLMLRQLTRVDPLSNLDSSPDSSPRSSRSELPAHIPRQRNDVSSLSEQANGLDSSGDWRDARDAGCRSFHSVDSESSSIMSSDIPGESAYNSSGDRSRPSSYPTENTGANRDLYLSSPDDSSADSDVKKRDHLLSLHDDKPLVESPKRTSESDVIRRDKQKAQRPLTRYLPIRSQEFDLRQHVESDGHQIELCPHVTLTSSTCSGTLHKLGGKWHAWKKRWFVFDRARRALLYYTDRKETKLRGGAYFQSIQEVYVDHQQSVKSPNPQSTFCMKTRDRVYYLMAPTPEAMRIWVDVIFTGAEGYLEFLGD